MSKAAEHLLGLLSIMREENYPVIFALRFQAETMARELAARILANDLSLSSHDQYRYFSS